MYSEFTVSGQDFATMARNNLRRTVFSPDGAQAVSMVVLRDGTLLFTNQGMVAFEFTITHGRRVLAVVKYLPHSSSLSINNNWRIQGDLVENFTIHENPDLFVSPNLNINIWGQNILRMDMKVDESTFACLVFSELDLLFVRMNGNHAYPRLLEVMQEEVDKATSFDSIATILDSKVELKTRIWKRLFRNWFFNGFL